MTPREAGWRQVLTLAAAVVIGVLALQVISAVVPAVGDALGDFPVIIVLLVTVTGAVLLLALRAQRPRR